MSTRNASYDSDKHRWRIWSRIDCLNAVKLACDEAGETITIHQFNVLHRVEPHIYPSTGTVRQYCGSWEYAIRWAGYEPNSRGKAGHREYERGNDDLASLYFT